MTSSEHEPLFRELWFECGACHGEVFIDSTPIDGLCWQCADELGR